MAVAPFREIERSYFDLRWHLDPVGATQAGVKTYDDRYGRFSPSALAPHLAPSEEDAGGVMALLGSPSITPIPHWMAWTVLISLTVLCLLGSLAAFSTREYVPRDTAE